MVEVQFSSENEKKTNFLDSCLPFLIQCKDSAPKDRVEGGLGAVVLL